MISSILEDIGTGYVVKVPPFNEQEKEMCTATLSGDIVLEFPKGVDGDGRLLIKDIVECINTVGKKQYNRVFEWCSGPGFLGYEIIGLGLANELIVSDYFPIGPESVIKNAETNNLADRVKAFVSATIGNIPKDEKFDLVISNPPFWPSYDSCMEHLHNIYPNFTEIELAHKIRYCLDLDWKNHIEFFENISDHLTPGADVFLVEGVCSDVWIKVAEDNGLTFIDAYKTKYLDIPEPGYLYVVHFSKT